MFDSGQSMVRDTGEGHGILQKSSCREDTKRGELFNTKYTTDTLKGIAISAVLINHYLNLNLSGDYSGFAYEWISIFFILSGYGLYHSFERLNFDRLTFRKLRLFYYQRFIRIFPLLWIAWFVQFLVTHGDISYWIPLGLHGNGHFWFIPALLQCYLLAPFLFWGIKKNLYLSLVLLSALLILANIIFMSGLVPHFIVKLAQFTESHWMNAYFLQIVFFTVGLLFPLFIPKRDSCTRNSNRIFHTAFFWILATFIIGIMLYLRYFLSRTSFTMLEFDVFPLFLMIFLCAHAIFHGIRNRLLEFLGRISYTIYLFHWSFYLLLRHIAGFRFNSTKELILCLILFPFFLYTSKRLEDFGSFIVSYSRSGAR